MVNIFFAGSALAAIVSIALAATGYYINSTKSNVPQAFYSDISELSTDSEKQDYLLSLHEENNRLAVSLDEINLEKEEVSSAHEALTANLEALTFEQEESHRQLEAVEQKYNKGLSEIAALQEVVSDLNMNKEQLTQSVSALEEENGRVSAAMKELSFGKEEISNAHQDITAERDEFQRQLGLMEEKYNSGVTEITALEENLSELNTQKQTYLEKIASLENVNNRLASEIAEINLAKKAALTTSQGLSADVEAITAEAQESQKQLTLMQEQYNKDQSEVVALQAVIAELNVEKEQYISNLSALEGEAKNAKLELSEKNDESKNTTALLDEAVKQIEALQAELEVSASKQQQLQDEINDLRAEKQNVDQSDNDEIESLRNDLVSLNKAIVSEQDEVSVLKKRIEELNVTLDGYKNNETSPSQPTVDLEAHLEGKLLINKSTDGVGFKYNNAQRLYLEYQLSYITEKDGPVALRGRPSLGNDKDILVPIQGDVADYLKQGQVIEFELIIFNALDNTKSKAWRGKFKIDLETSKLVIIH